MTLSLSLPRPNLRVFTVFLIVALPALAAAVVLSLGVGQARLRQSYGQHLSEVAEQSAAAIDAYVFRRIVDSSVLTRVGEVRAAVVAANRQPLQIDDVRRVDREWQRGGAQATVVSLLTTPASSFLADVVKQDPIYREILLTDLHGRLVAASNRTSDFYQADEDWWTEAYGDGARGQVNVSDARWDQSAQVYALEIALPVTEPTSERLAGILKIVADVREIGAVIGGLRLGATGDSVLLREDGTLVFSRRPQAVSARYFAADLLNERLQQGRLSDPSYHEYFSARAPDGDRLVAVAPSQLTASYPHLTWLVAVSQAEEELFAPIRAQMWSLIIALAVTTIAVLVLALWFSLRLAAHPVAEGMHLVEHGSTSPLEQVG